MEVQLISEVVRGVSLVSSKGKPKELIEYQRDVLKAVDDFINDPFKNLDSKQSRDYRKSLVVQMNNYYNRRNNE